MALQPHDSPSATRFLTHKVAGSCFTFYSADEIRKISAKAITSPVTFDTLNHPVTG